MVQSEYNGFLLKRVSKITGKISYYHSMFDEMKESPHGRVEPTWSTRTLLWHVELSECEISDSREILVLMTKMYLALTHDPIMKRLYTFTLETHERPNS